MGRKKALTLAAKTPNATLLEREDSTLVAWYRCLYAPRAGGAYDSHHRTEGIAGRTRRRGGQHGRSRQPLLGCAFFNIRFGSSAAKRHLRALSALPPTVLQNSIALGHRVRRWVLAIHHRRPTNHGRRGLLDVTA